MLEDGHFCGVHQENGLRQSWSQQQANIPPLWFICSFQPQVSEKVQKPERRSDDRRDKGTVDGENAAVYLRYCVAIKSQQKE